MRLPVAVAMLLVAPLAMAQAYKWTDASGTVHYSDAPPPQGTQYKRLKTNGSADPLEQPAAAASTASAAKPSKPAEKPVPPQDTPENRAKLCTAVKANLDTLKNSNGPIIMGEGDQQKVLSADDRAAQQTSNQAQYDQYCTQ